MPADTIDPAILDPQGVVGRATNYPEFYDEVIAAINDHAALIDAGGGGAGAATISIADYGAVADSISAGAANVTAIQAAIDAAAASGDDLFIPPGTWYLGRAAGQVYSLTFRGIENMTVRGIAGRSILKHIPDVSNGVAYCRAVEIVNCTNLTFDGVDGDGNWNNGTAIVASGSHLQALNALTGGNLYVENYDELPSSGTVTVAAFDGTTTTLGVVTYTGKTQGAGGLDPRLTGCTSPSTAVVRTGNVMGKFSRGQAQTTVALASNGVVPSGTLNVITAANFQTTAVAGEARIFTSNGWEFITWTGKGATTLTGVAGPTGTVVGAGDGSGSSIQNVTGQGGQVASVAAWVQYDPRNHWYFVYGSDGNYSLPNRGVKFYRCRVRNAYGDGWWIGQESSDTRLLDCESYLACRNGLTLSAYAVGVDLFRVKLIYAGTQALDSEPVEGPTRDITLYGCELRAGWNPTNTNGNIALSIAGGAIIRPAPFCYAENWNILNSKIYGATIVETARNIHFNGNLMTTDIGGSTGLSPLRLSQECTDIFVDGNRVYARNGAGASDENRGAISIVPYRFGTNSAGVPGKVKVTNNSVYARDGMVPIFLGAAGGYQGYSGTIQSFTAPSAPSTAGTLTFTGTPFTAGYFVGHRVLVGGVLANVTANTTSALTLAAVQENYTAGRAWYDRFGVPAPNPSISAGVTVGTILPTGGWIEIDGNTVDSGNDDGAGAGTDGIELDTSSTWDIGYNDMRIAITNNIVRNATGAGIRVSIPGSPAGWLTVTNNRVFDDAPVKTCTVGVELSGASGWNRVTFYGNEAYNGIAPGVAGALPLVTGLDTVPYYLASPTYPPVYAGSQDPNGLVYAGKQALFSWNTANVQLQKQSVEAFNTGWLQVLTSPYASYRSRGVTTGSAVNNTPVSPAATASVDGDIEILAVLRVGATATSFTTAGGFVEVTGTPEASATYASFPGVTMYLRLYWRRISGTKVQPVIAAGAGTFYIAKIYAIKDLIASGDPLDAAAVSVDPAGALPFGITGPTSTVANALVATFVMTFQGSATSASLGSVTQAALTELTEDVDESSIHATDRYLTALVTGRKAAAGACGAFAGTIASPVAGYSFTVAIQLALKPKT